MTILMIDRSPLDGGEREQSSPQSVKEKEREERGAWTIPQGQSDVQSFVVGGEIGGPCSREGTRRVTGRNRCSYTMNMYLVGCLFTKS